MVALGALRKTVLSHFLVQQPTVNREKLRRIPFVASRLEKRALDERLFQVREICLPSGFARDPTQRLTGEDNSN